MVVGINIHPDFWSGGTSRNQQQEYCEQKPFTHDSPSLHRPKFYRFIKLAQQHVWRKGRGWSLLTSLAIIGQGETKFGPATSACIESKNRHCQVDQAGRLKDCFKRFAESVHIVARQPGDIDTTGVDDIDGVLRAQQCNLLLGQPGDTEHATLFNNR